MRPIALALLVLFLTTPAAQDWTLPDYETFAAQVRTHLATDEERQSGYMFIERRTEQKLDGSGRSKDESVKVFEVYPGLPGEDRYRRLIEEDDKPVPEGKATIRFDFNYDGGGFGKGGTGTLTVNGEKVAEGRIDHTNAFIFSGDETADVGVDEATPVTEDYKESDNKFTGKIRKVTVEVGPVKVAAANQEELRRLHAALKAAE